MYTCIPVLLAQSGDPLAIATLHIHRTGVDTLATSNL